MSAKMGAYILGERLGAGGMAEVFVATGASNEQVAIKRILPGLARDAEFCEMFWDEARVMSRLEHPNVVRVLDYGADEGQLFIALEFVDGPSLARVLRKAARDKIDPNLNAIAFIGSELLSALDFVHNAKDAQGRELHIVHRDVSPGNVLLTTRGDVKLGDFGIVRSSIVARRTMPGELKGKMGYMSPEQALGEALGPASDLFSVGVILAELLVLRPLFLGKNEMDTLGRTVSADLSTWHRYNANVPLALRAVVERALKKRPEERYASAREMREAWLSAISSSVTRYERRDAWEFLHKLELAASEAPDTSGERQVLPKAGAAPSKPPEGAIPVRRISSKEIPVVSFEAGQVGPPPPRSLTPRPGAPLRPPLPTLDAGTNPPGPIHTQAPSHTSLRSLSPQPGVIPIPADAARGVGKKVWEVSFSAQTLPLQIFLGLRRVRSGIVEVREQGRSLTLEVVDGKIVAAHDSEGTAPLGRLIVEEGTIDRAELVRAIGESRRAGLRLGEYLVMMRKLRESALLRLLRMQFEARLGSWITRQSGTVSVTQTGEGRALEGFPEAFSQVIAVLRKSLPPETLTQARAAVFDSVLLPIASEDDIAALGLLPPEARVLSSVLEGGALEGRSFRLALEALTSERIARGREVEFALLTGLWVGVLRASGFPAG